MTKFEFGQIIITPGVAETFRECQSWVALCLRRHLLNDWGDLDAHDKRVNNDAVKHGGRLLSEYRRESGVRLWIITESNRSATTLLLPSEY